MDSQERRRIETLVKSGVSSLLICARQKADLTIDEAARLLGHASVAKLEGYESGATLAPMYELDQILKIYGLPNQVMIELHEQLQRSLIEIRDF